MIINQFKLFVAVLQLPVTKNNTRRCGFLYLNSAKLSTRTKARK